MVAQHELHIAAGFEIGDSFDELFDIVGKISFSQRSTAASPAL